MGRVPQDVTEAELAVLQALWERDGPATVRQLAEELYPDKGAAGALATVQKLLERLEAKGCVRRQKGEAGPQLFSAAVGREDLIGRRLRAVAEQLCEGSLTPLLTNLVRAGSLSARERKELRALLEELTQGKPK